MIQHCLRLFTRFPFNNLLHHRVAGLVLTALERGSDDFLTFLFGPCQLIRWLTQAPETVTPAARDTDSKEGVTLAATPRHVSHTCTRFEVVKNAPPTPQKFALYKAPIPLTTKVAMPYI